MAAKVFISYSRADETYKDALLDHLALLRNEGLIEPWHDRQLTAGQDYSAKIDIELASADIILLLISAKSISSRYCYSRELLHAMSRYEKGLARVVPIIVRPCEWASAPFAKLTVLPRDGKAITSWPDQDEAYRNIAQGIRLMAEEVRSARARARVRRHAIVGAAVVACLAALAYGQLWHMQTRPGPAPPALLLSTQGANSPDAADSARSAATDAPAGAGQPLLRSGTTPLPAVLVRDKNAPSAGESAGARSIRDAARPDTLASSSTAEPSDTLFASEGVIVIAEVATTPAPGQTWEAGNDLAQLPDVLLCFRQSANGEEICRPNWFGVASARTRAHEDASHAVDLFADMKHWNATFWLALRDQDGFERKLMGQGECRFGKPCAITWAGDEKTAIAEALVLPTLQSSETLRTRYLRRCVDGSGVLAHQWEALVAFANPGGITPPAASRISYETLARTFIAATDIELTGGTLKAALDAGKGQGRLAHVPNTFRATLLQAEANIGRKSPSATRDAVERRSTLLRQRLADMGLDRLIAAGCQ